MYAAHRLQTDWHTLSKNTQSLIQDIQERVIVQSNFKIFTNTIHIINIYGI